MSTMSFDIAQPDLIREVLALKLSSDENDSKLLESSSTKSCTEATATTSSPTPKFDDKNCHSNGKKFGHKIKKSEYFIKVNGDASRKIKKKRRREMFTKSSCISQ